MFVIVLPIVLGAGLTGLGVFRLIQASEKGVSRQLSPYGILAFCSEECDSFDLSMNLYYFDFKGDSVMAFCIINFDLPASAVNGSSFEVTFGLQIPYQAEIEQDVEQGKRISVAAGENELEVLEAETLFSQVDRTSIFYFRFMTEPENEYYHVNLTLCWKGLVSRQSFALYEIVVPFCSSINNTVARYFSDIHPLNYTALGLSVELPDDCEIRDMIPLPDREELTSMSSPETPEVLVPHRYLSWQFPNNRVLTAGGMWPRSDIARVRFELLGESELQNRLLFDSGLYLGLGIGLLISGLHEALKYSMETRKVTVTSP